MRTLHFLGELAGVPFPDAADETLRSARANPRLLGDLVRTAWEAFLTAECAAHPVLLVLDDLQWADTATVRLVDTTLRSLRDLPLMILALARPEVHERFPGLWAEREVQSIKLGPLPRRSSEQIVRAALGPETPSEVVADLVARGEGNPFYLEELVRAHAAGRADGVVDEGGLPRSSGARPPSVDEGGLPRTEGGLPPSRPRGDRPEGGGVPHAVLGMVEARLDAESPEAKRVLRAASVFGERFSLGGVIALLGGTPAELGPLLEALVAHEIVTPVSTRRIRRTLVPDGPPEEDPHYLFCHALLREAAYATLTEGDRALGHRLAGAWLASQDAPEIAPGSARGRVSPYAMSTGPAVPAPAQGRIDPMTVAEHLRLGGDPGGAVRWYRRAAEQALGAHDFPAAVERAGRGLASGATGEDLGHLRLVLAEAHVWRGDLGAAEESGLTAAAALPPGSAAWYRAVTHAVIAASKQGGFDRVDARAALSLSATPAPGARGPQIVCLAECAVGLLFAGRYSAADTLLAHLRRAVRDPAALEPSVASHFYKAVALRAIAAGDHCAALEGFEASLSALEAGEDHREACAARSNLGVIFTELGDYESAEEVLREALAVTERLHLGELGPGVLSNLGHALAYRGRLDEARACEARAVAEFHRLGDPRMEGVSRTYLAKIALLAGDAALAEAEARAAADLLQVAPPVRAPALAILARALLAQSRPAEALTAAREGQAALDALGELEEGESLVRLVHAEALAAAGREAEARSALLAARSRLLLRADRITALAWRERFLMAVPENARTLALSGQVGGDPRTPAGPDLADPV
jgi:tetratricopeptide (TPR) repeat protein